MLEWNRLLFLDHETIRTSYYGLLLIHLLLIFVGGILDFLLHVAAFDGFQDPTHHIDLFQIYSGASFDFIGHSFEKIRASQGIDSLGNTGLVPEDLLCA